MQADKGRTQEFARNSLLGMLFTFIALIVLMFFVVLFLLIFGGAEQPVQYYSHVPDRYYDDDLSEEIYSAQGNRKKI